MHHHLKGKSVLVTGAGGFIGSHLTERLVDLGCSVKAFVRYNSSNSWGWLDKIDKKKSEEIEVFSGDIRDPNGVRVAMQGVDYVFHLAALIGIPYSYHSPDSYIDVNIKGTLNVLQAARDLNTERVIHTSTSEIYGTAQFVPISELHPTNPQSPYAATKSGADFLALSYWRSFKTPVVVVRPFNTFGPRQSARAIIPTIISQLAAGRTQIKVGSLTPRRDFTLVHDTVEGFLHASNAPEALGEIINLGVGYDISIGETIELISKIMGKKVEVELDEQRVRPALSEVERLLSDNSKAKQLINWTPKYSFEEGLKKTVDWFVHSEESKNLYKPDIYNI